ncbi:hypothetical protein COW36_10765 [bacterium (Candidatus Blackallbacteria) CG17_big_fil_post_rev_8_21_14_2_50_48_46]|uniref:Uncharacterized protein n=1 Tax=bacterium (Candidatus Blackallbacteria) CG17_big_fil_post_rev_8_21_14_2_50_48_46 TaxID=2014261 RepID=A0A2M7G565_9BACT|nr:MAG: hypothetical protein COW64_20555 [bacterium (Candidatus Blackallbacteria) CG18_big_fil_WC_8_21_14_2_50_49_26]PIW16949.1 MAG: hypothetical protein COW36_10765 [bacterium (Candidatus Blackallbacteria) CG17_big_fil_post_rev_8_21_14_2_50_48_46]PIW50228.1 MAG: hypothetical protein COW20_03280 [bacterium (Candidatus Blackallbacteria) CG13_big_fil_rev_8_21_14_2_50_49_14]
MMNIFSIANKLDVSWHPEIATVLESWTDFNVELEEFRKAVFVKGINHARGSQAKAWIFDPSKASGEFSEEILGMIAQDRFPALGWTGVKYFITIHPEATEILVNPDTSMTRGVQRVDAPSVESAMAFIKENP